MAFEIDRNFGDDELSESELYKELGILTKNKDKWEENIPYVSSLLAHDSVKIKAKALWLLGEMGFVYPLLVQDAVSEMASFCDSFYANEQLMHLAGSGGETST